MMVLSSRLMATGRNDAPLRALMSATVLPVNSEEASIGKTTSASLPPEKSTYSVVEVCPSRLMTSRAAIFSG